MKLSRAVFRYIEHELYNYDTTLTEIENIRVDIIEAPPLRETIPSSGYISDPTARKGTQLVTNTALVRMTRTVAASLPFGTLLYIEGIGLRRVNDRGVGPGRIDVVTETRAQAFEIGRSRRRVIILSRRGRCEVYCQFFRRQGQHMHVDRIDKKRLPN